MQVIENRADLEATVVSVRSDDSRPGHRLVSLDVHAVHSVESYPNLLQETAGKTVEVVAPDEAAGALAAGSRVRGRARRTGPASIYAESFTRI